MMEVSKMETGELLSKRNNFAYTRWFTDNPEKHKDMDKKISRIDSELFNREDFN